MKREDKQQCAACGNMFPQKWDKCPCCHWPAFNTEPTNEDIAVRSLRRIARAADSISYYLSMLHR